MKRFLKFDWGGICVLGIFAATAICILYLWVKPHVPEHKYMPVSGVQIGFKSHRVFSRLEGIHDKKPMPGNEFLVCRISLKNTTGNIINLDTTRFQLRDSHGQKFMDDGGTTAYKGVAAVDSLLAFEPSTCDAIFEVPRGTVPQDVQLLNDLAPRH